MKGPNLAGDCLRAQQLIACVPEPLPTSAPQTLRRYAAATGALTSEKLSCLWESMKSNGGLFTLWLFTSRAGPRL